ncbi:MAG: hypothetical protein SLAVMIC_00084 [uncultured marine phage]|uniref:Uncharacterized protein n=1 Tax=uncultured marine phage TaxID=707152 RepID=A0A8D9CB04_9VIRU|nr:MAG: hypothetical protein SLAVMIC_00084 [uncultured marine phage]
MDLDEKKVEYLNYLETVCEQHNIMEFDDLINRYLIDVSEVSEEDLNDLSGRIKNEVILKK